jgi:hypothetical protein
LHFWSAKRWAIAQAGVMAALELARLAPEKNMAERLQQEPHSSQRPSEIKSLDQIVRN